MQKFKTNLSKGCLPYIIEEPKQYLCKNSFVCLTFKVYKYQLKCEKVF